jgi:hypothetical protein
MVETLNQQAKRFLANVPEENVFRCGNGHILRNMKELAEELKTMSEESYTFHANKQKNDFANWVRDIIKDERLAADLQKTPKQSQAAKLVASRISILSKRLT